MIYLLKVAAAIALVTLPYYLALRTDANLVVKRIYLVTGILLSWTFPLLSVRKPAIVSSMEPVFLIDPGQPAAITGAAGVTSHASISPATILFALYLVGILAFIVLNLIAFSRLRKITNRRTGKKNVFLTRGNKVFTIYPNIFLPEKFADTAENNAILIHERAHIRQLHMADLLVAELSLALTWFNPFSWLISRMIKENHEHLADREVLSQGVRPAHYKSLLLNHTLGGEVFRLGHQFNHSLTKKRFIMMKKTKAKKKGILKYILFVPTILAFTLMATAAGQQASTIEGKVYLETSEVPATGASVIIAGTTMGTVVDEQGAFTLEVTGNPRVVISFVGYESASVTAREIARKPIIMIPTSYEIVPYENEHKASKKETVRVKMIEEDITEDGDGKKVKVQINSDNVADPVVVVDGEVVASLDEIDPEQIAQVKVIKDADNELMKKYDAETGVIMITTKKDSGDKQRQKMEHRDHPDEEREMKEIRVKVVEGIETSEDAKAGSGIEKEIEVEIQTDEDIDMEERGFYIVEDLPSFPGGRAALGQYIEEHLEYPADASHKKTAGKVMVEFKVQPDGTLDNIRVAQSSNDIFNKAALAVFEDMPAWKPGKQRGKAVTCKVIVPVRFIPDAE